LQFFIIEPDPSGNLIWSSSSMEANFFVEKKSKMALESFKNIETTHLDVDNYEIY
jgi:hypothetical protein